MFFSKFPKVVYNGIDMVDISKRMILIDSIKQRAETYTNYIVKEGEKIEDVAYDAYGDPSYHWVIILMNDIVDPFFDWPLSTKELDSYVSENYPGAVGAPDSPYSPHHYEYNGGIFAANSTPGALYNTITNKDFEISLNEAKRSVKILRSDYLAQIENELETVLK